MMILDKNKETTLACLTRQMAVNLAKKIQIRLLRTMRTNLGKRIQMTLVRTMENSLVKSM
ncbi:hypothetical protein FOYG_17554 [Fusarium oxysporum NRRL 32931]|uniref:Uncharacterized protein n=1 Tax=Fusarium oxysporum NRRL 32931 TaxID=660029 RepID=W9HE37_FUSOX|nr:hypothetical protein FOYG_17554 [Fusarium oxysporum NRRL 32931]